MKTDLGFSAFGLTAVFVILKLTGAVTWSWWLVTLPMWIGFAFWAVVVGVIFIMAVIATWLSNR